MQVWHEADNWQRRASLLDVGLLRYLRRTLLRSDGMGLFEENPLLMVPFILVVVGLYDLGKWALRRSLPASWIRRRG